MKKPYLFSFMLLFQGTFLFSQTIDWTCNSPGGNGLDEAFSVTQTLDSGYVFSGRTGAIGVNAGDFYIGKLSSTGGFLWSKTYAGSSMDEARAIKQLADSTYVIAGVTVDFGSAFNTSSTNAQDLFLMKLNTHGDTVWTKHFGGTGADTGDALDTVSGGGFIIAGRYGVNGADNDFYLVRTDVNGDSLWTKRYGGSGSDVARSVKQTKDGGFIIAGTTKSFGDNAATGNMWLIKTNAMGDTSWTKAIGTTDEEECYSVSLTKDGGYILTGRTGSNTSNAADIYIVKTDSTGKVEWTKTYGSTENDLGRGIIQTTDAGFALTGWKYTNRGAYDTQLMYVLKMDSVGVMQWDTMIGNDNSPNGAMGYSISQTMDGGLVVAGENDLGSGSADVRATIVKLSYHQITAGIASREIVIDKIIAYPNPFRESVTILIPQGLKGDAVVDIFDMTGKLILAKQATSSQEQATINKCELSTGMYFYRISASGSSFNFRGKLVVQ